MAKKSKNRYNQIQINKSNNLLNSKKRESFTEVDFASSKTKNIFKKHWGAITKGYTQS